MKINSLFKFQGSLDLLCRQIEASPSLAIDAPTLGYYLPESEKPPSGSEGLPPAPDKTGELPGSDQSKRDPVIRPKWNPERLTLFVGDTRCRKFTRANKTNQIRIMEALEKAGWPKMPIPNPLRDEIQLAQTIKDFNKKRIEGSPFRLTQDHNQVGWTIG